jgi:LD-carboxypeptidase C-terminal domain
VLRFADVLDRIAGMVVGATEVELTEGGPKLGEVVLDVLGERDIPVLGNVDIGHNGPNIPMPIGVRVTPLLPRASRGRTRWATHPRRSGTSRPDTHAASSSSSYRR